MRVFEQFAALREKYPYDIDQIEREEAEAKRLLEMQDYAALEQTQYLLALCRKEVMQARMRLAAERDLTEAQRAELWTTIDARQWFINVAARDYEAELSAIDRDLELALSL